MTQSRQNPLPTEEAEQFLDRIRGLARHFDENWLDIPGGKHRLQQLWARSDILSSIELYTLGDAISCFEGKHSNWIEHQKKRILEPNLNNQNGAFFELVALRLLHSADAEAIPTSPNTKGIDVKAVGRDGATLEFSLKRWHSSFQNSFESNCHKLVESLKANLSGRIQPSISIGFRRYPDAPEWNKVQKEISSLLRSHNGMPQNHEIRSLCGITITPLVPDDGFSFGDQFRSYTFNCISPFHKNEKRNFLAKLEEAALNLSKHGVIGDDKALGLMIRLAPNAPLVEMANWAREYVQTSDIIGIILFVQVEYMQDSTDQLLTSYHAHLETGPQFRIWSNRYGGRKITLEIPIGVPSIPPLKLKIESPFADQHPDGHYQFQKGDHYFHINAEEKGVMKRTSLGVSQHVVIRCSDQDAVISAKIGNEVLIL